jgi:hypothetical protein
MLRSYLFAGIIMLLFACGSQEENDVQVYWNSKLFFEQDTVALQSFGLKKELMFNDNSQTVVLKNVIWTKELEPFLTLDLQKTSYKGRFTIDTLPANDSIYIVTYKAIESKLDLHKVEITMNAITQKVNKINAEYKEENSLYSATKTLTYIVGNGYNIKGMQQVKLGNQINYEVNGTFEKNR